MGALTPAPVLFAFTTSVLLGTSSGFQMAHAMVKQFLYIYQVQELLVIHVIAFS